MLSPQLYQLRIKPEYVLPSTTYLEDDAQNAFRLVNNIQFPQKFNQTLISNTFKCFLSQLVDRWNHSAAY